MDCCTQNFCKNKTKMVGLVATGGTSCGTCSTPLNFPVENIFRFRNTSIPGSYLYVGEQEAQTIRANFTNYDEEGFAFQVGIEPGDNLIPFYRFQSNRIPGTYVFIDEQTRGSIDQNPVNGFTEEGLAFYAYGAGSGLGDPIYVFQNSSLPGTFLYVGEEERNGIVANFSNFTELGIAFEVL